MLKGNRECKYNFTIAETPTFHFYKNLDALSFLLSNNCQSKSHNGAIQRKRIFPFEAKALISNIFNSQV